jgi:hypothetical protein
MIVIAYTDAVERVLGASKGSIHLMDTEALKEWFPSNDTLQRKSLAEEAGIPGSPNP